MCAPPEWLPDLILLAEHEDDWSRYVDAVYSEFYRDFVQTQPKFQNKWVRCRRDPIVDGKEAGFWHCISSGQSEATRTPEIRRMERIRWVRAVIEHADAVSVDCWSN